MHLLGVRGIQERKRNRGPRTPLFWTLFAVALPFGIAGIVFVWQSKWLPTALCMIVFLTLLITAEIYRDRDYLRGLRSGE